MKRVRNILESYRTAARLGCSPIGDITFPIMEGNVQTPLAFWPHGQPLLAVQLSLFSHLTKAIEGRGRKPLPRPLQSYGGLLFNNDRKLFLNTKATRAADASNTEEKKLKMPVL